VEQNRDKWILKLIDLYDSPKEEHYLIQGYKIPKVNDGTGSVWIDGGSNICGLFDAEIIDREWLEIYKDIIHPHDEWTNVNLETYGKWIKVFNKEEGDRLVKAALKSNVVGYLD